MRTINQHTSIDSQKALDFFKHGIVCEKQNLKSQAAKNFKQSLSHDPNLMLRFLYCKA